MELKFLKKEKSFKKTNLFFNTNLYWQLAVCGAFILSVASCFFGYYLFINTNNESISQSPIYDYKRNEVVNKEKIDTILDYFSVRKQKSNQILYSPSPVVDPSL